MDIILKYFNKISETQRSQFERLYGLYADWNSKINVISRKDIDFLYEHHVLHSLSIAKAVNFRPDTNVLDLGTGGGFPGIPLAIMFPETKFKLIDGTGKKITVVKNIIEAIGLKNCEAEHVRGENESGLYDFVVSRAVMNMPELVKLIKKNISKKHNNSVPNGLFCLKGGNISAEIQPYRNIVEVTDLSGMFDEVWFKNKYLVYLPL